LNCSRDGNAGAPHSSIELIEAGFGQTDPTADFGFGTISGMDFWAKVDKGLEDVNWVA